MFTPMENANSTYIQTLRLASDEHDKLALRLRLSHNFAALDVSPPDLPPHALLCIRHLRIARTRHTGTSRTHWERTIASEVRELFAHAARPALAEPAMNAAAVLFMDRAEMLACLASDWCTGKLYQRWWWQHLFGTYDARNLPIRAWQETPHYIPAAMQRLAIQQQALPFLRQLPAPAAHALLVEMLRHFGLHALYAVCTEEVAVEAAFSLENPEHVQTTLSNKGENTRNSVPWQQWLPEYAVLDLPPERQLLLATSLLLARTPAVVRTTAFARDVQQWRQEKAHTTGVNGGNMDRVGARGGDVVERGPRACPTDGDTSNDPIETEDGDEAADVDVQQGQPQGPIPTRPHPLPLRDPGGQDDIGNRRDYADIKDEDDVSVQQGQPQGPIPTQHRPLPLRDHGGQDGIEDHVRAMDIAEPITQLNGHMEAKDSNVDDKAYDVKYDMKKYIEANSEEINDRGYAGRDEENDRVGARGGDVVERGPRACPIGGDKHNIKSNTQQQGQPPGPLAPLHRPLPRRAQTGHVDNPVDHSRDALDHVDEGLEGEQVFETHIGGLFYLINVALHLELYGDFTRPLQPGISLSIWDLLALLGYRLLGSVVLDDPLWALLAQLAGRAAQEAPGSSFEPDPAWRLPVVWLAAFPDEDRWQWQATAERLRVYHTAGFLVLDVPRIHDEPVETQLEREIQPYRERLTVVLMPREKDAMDAASTSILSTIPGIAPAVARWLDCFAPYLYARLQRALGTMDNPMPIVCMQHAHVTVTATHLDIALSLATLPLELRMAGLDRDPGWVPAAGRYIAFHFA